jgi:isochorismate synthase
LEEALIDTRKRKLSLEDVSLKELFYLGINNRLGAAIWRNPDQKEIHVVINFSEGLQEFTHPNLEQISAGFLISPYENDNNLLYYFIHSDLHVIYSEDAEDIRHLNRTVPFETIQEYFEKPFVMEHKRGQLLPDSEYQEEEQDQKDFRDLVRLSIERIAVGEFQKVVPSRLKEIDLQDNFDVVSTFVRLCAKHPKAFISLFYLPEKGVWMGASPELLIEISKDNIFRTSALAGTQPGENIINLSEVAWTQKEIEEQAFVSRYIINCFKKIRLREFEENGPKTVEAGGLVHLRTDYKVNLEKVNFAQLGSVMLKLLHPTSAVCGMPKEPASAFLKVHEKIDRKFFGGYLGPVNIDAHTNLYVNLRCANIKTGKAVLYAGAGVTSDSDPEKEWRETELKMGTIQSVLLSQ